MKNINFRSIRSIVLLTMFFNSGVFYGSSRLGYEFSRKLAPKVANTIVPKVVYSPAVAAAYKALGLSVGAPALEVIDVYSKIRDNSFSPYNYKDMQLKQNLGKQKDWLEYSQDFRTIKQMNPEAFEAAEKALNQQRAQEAQHKLEMIRKQLVQEQAIRDQQALEAQQKQQELMQQLENQSRQVINLTSSSSGGSLVGDLGSNSVTEAKLTEAKLLESVGKGDMLDFFSGLSKMSKTEAQMFVSDHKQMLAQASVKYLIDEHTNKIMLALAFQRSLNNHIFNSIQDFADALIQEKTLISSAVTRNVCSYSDFVITLFQFQRAGDIKEFSNALELYKILASGGQITSQLVGDPVKRAARNTLERLPLSIAVSNYDLRSIDQALQRAHECLMTIKECVQLNIVSKSDSLQVQESVRHAVQKIYDHVSKRSFKEGSLSVDQRKALLQKLENFGAAPKDVSTVQELFGDLLENGEFSQAATLWSSRKLELSTVGGQNTVLDVMASNLGSNDLGALGILKFGLTQGITFKQIATSPEFVSQITRTQGHVFTGLFSACETLQDYKLVTVLLENCEHLGTVSAEQKQRVASALRQDVTMKAGEILFSLALGVSPSSGSAQSIANTQSIVDWLSSRKIFSDNNWDGISDELSSLAQKAGHAENDTIGAGNKDKEQSNKKAVAILIALVGAGSITKEMASSVIENSEDISAAQKEELNETFLQALRA